MIYTPQRKEDANEFLNLSPRQILVDSLTLFTTVE